MVTAILFALGVAGIVMSAALAAVCLPRTRARRGDSSPDFDRLLAEVERALADPILIAQARRRVRRRHSHDG